MLFDSASIPRQKARFKQKIHSRIKRIIIDIFLADNSRFRYNEYRWANLTPAVWGDRARAVLS